MVIHNISFPSSTALGCATCRPMSSLCFFILVFNTCRKADIKSLYVMWYIMNIEKADDWLDTVSQGGQWQRPSSNSNNLLAKTNFK